MGGVNRGLYFKVQGFYCRISQTSHSSNQESSLVETNSIILHFSLLPKTVGVAF